MGTIDSTIARMSEQRVYIDANVFIYFLDRHAVYFDAVSRIFQACVGQQVFAAVAEVMTGPYRQDDPALAARFKRFFAQKNFLAVTPHDSTVFDAAAMPAARKRLKFINARHVATALQAGCAFFLTNDAGIEPGASIEVICLADLVD